MLYPGRAAAIHTANTLDLTMTDSTPPQTHDQRQALAKAYGLEKLLALDPDAFSAALMAANGLSQRTARAGHFAEEPAHHCHFTNRGTRT